MKFAQVVLVSLVGGLMAIASQAAASLANGGFEETTNPSNGSPFVGWSFNGRFERGDYVIAASDSSHAGRYACEIACRKKGRAGIASAPLPIAGGTALEVSFWVKAKGATGGRVFLNFEGSPGDGWAGKDLPIGNYGWTRFSQRVVVPAGKSSDPQSVVLYFYTTCEGTVWLDDVAVRELDPKAAEAPPVQPHTPATIPEPANSRGYRLNVVSGLEKVFREDDFPADPQTRLDFSIARNEYESLQLVVEAPWRALSVKEVRVTDLKGPNGAVIPASALRWDREEYVTSTVNPPYFTERGLASYPDPLLPAGPFVVNQQSRVPLWMTLKTPSNCPPGEYLGSVTVVPENRQETTLPVRVTVWDFALGDKTHLRTLTWLTDDNLRQWYGLDKSPEGERKLQLAARNYHECLLQHRLGPGGEVVANVQADSQGKFDFRGVDETLQRLIDRGMNAFIMATAPNLERAKQATYTPQFVEEFTHRVQATSAHLKEKGWQDLAYVYVYDEAPRAAWPEVKRIDQAIHAAAPGTRILQCLNQPDGVRELTGFADVFDVYVAQYHKSGVAQSQKRGAELWLAVCAYPIDRPNFFLEYPLLDMRVAPWIGWKYRANGFEYWSANAWGVNLKASGDKWPQAPWVANAFRNYNGDGYLLYPGLDMKPLSSIRLEALRDGLEDYEYLWTLDSLLQQAVQKRIGGSVVDRAWALLSLDGLVKANGSSSLEPGEYLAYRRQLAEAIVALRNSMKR